MSRQRIISCSLNEVKESDILNFFDELKRETHSSDSQIIKDALRFYAQHYHHSFIEEAVYEVHDSPVPTIRKEGVKSAINNMLLNSGQLRV